MKNILRVVRIPPETKNIGKRCATTGEEISEKPSDTRGRADTCAELSKQDAANIQYPRDRAVALGTMSRIDLNLSRLTDAVASARESVSILEQLTSSDRRNASFRLDLSAARVALSNAYYYSGQASEALQNAALAVAIQEEEAVSNPDNPDFPRQTAANYRSAGNIKSLLKDFPGAVEQYRKAETVDRKLRARYPERFEFCDALRADLDSIAAIYLALGDTPSALRAYRDSLLIARSAASAQPTDESLAGLATAQEGLANGLGAMARWDEAIAEQQAAVAIREKQSAGKTDDRSLQRALARADEGLGKLYESRGDYRAALLISEKPRHLFEAGYDQLGDDETRTELLNLLSCQRTQYAGAADYQHALAAANEIVDIMKPTGVIARTRAYRDLGDTLLHAGRREESLKAFRDAAVIMNERPIEKESSSLYRNESSGTYLYVVSGFTAARREEESAVLLKRVLPVAEALVQDNPANNLYRDTLVRVYRAAATAFAGLGDSVSSVDFEEKVLKLEPAPVFPGDSYQRGLRLARIASVELRLGHRESAQGRWREALEMFQTAARGGAQQLADDPRNNSARETQRLADAAASLTLEQLGDLPLEQIRDLPLARLRQ